MSSSSSSAHAPPRGVMVTNDDGPICDEKSPFVQLFVLGMHQAFHGDGARLFVCLPAQQQSWTGKSVTAYQRVAAHLLWDPTGKEHPIEPEQQQKQPTGTDEKVVDGHQEGCGTAWPTPHVAFVEGTPSTTVNIGLNNLCPFPIDLVISGPNYGMNAGRAAIASSGTVGAAIEAVMAGKKAIALSFAYRSRQHTLEDRTRSVHVAIKIIRKLWAEWPSDVQMFNINVPLGCEEDVDVYMAHVFNGAYYGSLYKQDTEQNQTPTPTSTSTSTHTSSAEKRLAEQTTKTIRFKWHLNAIFSDDQQQQDDFQGSDMWCVQHGVASVTAMLPNFGEDQRCPLLFPKL